MARRADRAARAAAEALRRPPVHPGHDQGQGAAAAAQEPGDGAQRGRLRLARGEVREVPRLHERGAVDVRRLQAVLPGGRGPDDAAAGPPAAPGAGRHRLRVTRRQKVLLGALAAAQVASAYVPARRQPAATRAIVAGMLGVSLLEAWEARGPRGVAAVATAGATGFAIELAGVATGRPFGHYSYSDKLG